MHAELIARQSADVRRGSARLAELAAFSGEVSAFWPAYLEAVGLVFVARRVLLLSRDDKRGWQPQAQWPQGASDQTGDAMRILRLADGAAEESPCLEAATDEHSPNSSGEDAALRSGRRPALSARLAADAVPAGQTAVIVILPQTSMAGAAPADAATLIALADLAVSIPAQYARSRALVAHAASQTLSPTGSSQATGAERLYDVLQSSIRLGAETRFMRAALTFANELAVRFNCDRVSLGWVLSRYVRLTAVSHVEKFDRRANASRELESAMEEALDQNIELVWPSPPEATVVGRAHEIYARTQGSGYLLSVPLRVDQVVVAVLTLERRARAFEPDETWELRLIGEASARQLMVLHDRDRWIGARALARMLAWRDLLLGPSYTAWKLVGVGTALLITLLAMLPWPYRISTPVALRSKDILFIPAPFDGYLRHAHIEVGDAVRTGTLLVELDTRALILEEAMAAADAVRYGREAEKAQAARQLADMQIALARQQQAVSKLELTRHQLANAQLRAPFSGVVVEGELKKNLGAPVRKGDLLVKLAHTGETYVELEVGQADVHEIAPGMRGEFSFVGRPELRYPLIVERVDPAATTREGRNVYLARARIEAEFQPWWRPGMGGSARLEAGERSVIWLLTYRTIRYLRQVFWI
jgi:multidrug resistance efflux pump